MALTIHGFNSMDLYIPENTIGVLLMNAGKSPDVDPSKMRLFGYRESLHWPDGGTRPGVLQPLTVWYIEGADKKILVENGASDEGVALANEAFLKRGQGQVYVREARHDVEGFLNRLGTSCSEIDIVVLTHLHVDHILNTAAFPKARFIVQRDELPWGVAPPPYAEFHWREFAPFLLRVHERLDVIDGDKTICPGVELMRVGGHTAGSQAVSVQTASGRVILAGDFFYNFRNIEHSWPIGSFYRLDEWIRNCERLKSMSPTILPTHDFYFWELFPDGRVA